MFTIMPNELQPTPNGYARGMFAMSVAVGDG
jgi:hypothetical protein